MSLNAMCAVQEHSRAKGIEFLVMLTLGDCCDHFGVHEFGSFRWLAKRAHISQAACESAVRNLVKQRELVWIDCAGPTMAARGIAINLDGSGYADLVAIMEERR